MARAAKTQRELVRATLKKRGMARLTELKAAGATAATVTRMEADGEVVRLARGLYQLPDTSLDAHHTLAEAAKLIPKGVVCLTSALAFHDLTDQLPAKVWLAIGKDDWASRQSSPPIRIVRMTHDFLARDVERHVIEGVPVKVFGLARTIADCFRHRRSVGLSVAIEALGEALRQRKASPAELERHAARGGVATVMRPYLEALVGG